LDPETGFISPRSFSVGDDGHPDLEGLPYDLMPARVSHDAWSFGMLLYNICIDISFFNTNNDDGISQQDLQLVYECDAEFIRSRLSNISDMLARNLISQLLVKDPRRRVNMTQVLDHPFLTGKKPARMIGQPPEFDVFLSYRVSSDSAHVEILYNLLTGMGLKVWWDKMCLGKGISWEEGFCDGLLKSRSFVPLLSRGALKNFETLTLGSWCDNVLLEYNLALELRERGLVEFVYPAFLGDLMSDSSEGESYSDYFGSGCHPNLSASGGVTVNAVIEKLNEHLGRSSLGSLLLDKLSVKEVLSRITINQGFFVKGQKEAAFNTLANNIKEMLGEGGVASME